MYTPAVAGRAPAPYIALGRADAERLGAAEGDWLELLAAVDETCAARCRCALPSLPEGVAGVPVGLPGLPFLSLPGRGRIARTDRSRRPGRRRRPARLGARRRCAGPDDAPDGEAPS